MDKIPPEIWEKVFDNLCHPEDCANASSVLSIWHQVLQPAKSSWLFGKVLPMLLQYLSKNDIFHCRLVCWRWCNGIDHLLENNIFHRPAFTESSKVKVQYVNYDDPLVPLYTILHGNSSHISHSYTVTLLHTNLQSPKKRQRILWESIKTSSRSAFIGRSIRIVEYPKRLDTPSNIEFLQIFGHHISNISIYLNRRKSLPIQCADFFENIDFYFSERSGCDEFTPHGALYRIKELMKLVPNARKLVIYGKFSHWYTEDEKYIVNKELDKMIVNEENQFLPNLETFDVFVGGICRRKFGEALLSLFGNPNLKYLRLRGLENWISFGMTNLISVNLRITCNDELSELAQLSFPLLQHLYLEYRCSYKVAFKLGILFDILCNFKKSLCSFGFKYAVPYMWGDMYSATGQDRRLIILEENRKEQAFFDTEILNQLTKLRHISIEGHVLMLPSLNFLCGISNSLESLHLRLDDFLEEKVVINKSVRMEESCNRSIDLLDRFDEIWDSREISLYESNVWDILPKLNILSVFIQSNVCNLRRNHRRELYEKYQSQRYFKMQVR